VLAGHAKHSSSGHLLIEDEAVAYAEPCLNISEDLAGTARCSEVESLKRWHTKFQRTPVAMPAAAAAAAVPMVVLSYNSLLRLSLGAGAKWCVRLELVRLSRHSTI